MRPGDFAGLPDGDREPEKFTKETPIPLTDGKFEFPASQLPKIIWVEATLKSATVRDILLKLGHQPAGGPWDDDIDRVRATAIWADYAPAAASLRNQPTQPMWPDASQALKDSFNDIPGHFGPVDKPTHLLNCIGFEFTVFPMGIGSEPNVKFDITRQIETKQWILGPGVIPLEFLAMAKSFPAGDLSNDDATQPDITDESNQPTNDHIYSVDWPGSEKALKPNLTAPATEFVVKMNFREYVRVSFNGTSPTGNTLSGSRCSPKRPWHTIQSLKVVNGQIANGVFIAGEYAVDPNHTNEIMGGDIPVTPPQ